jgi:hypothetical protein
MDVHTSARSGVAGERVEHPIEHVDQGVDLLPGTRSKK